MMIIKRCAGCELVKAQSNTSEDYFNRSEVTYIHDDIEKTLYVLYVRYFEENLSEVSSFIENPVFRAGEREVYFRDIVALACLLQHPELMNRKRIYINTQKEMVRYIQNVSADELERIMTELEKQGEAKVSMGQTAALN
jgi:hypothetical protein